MSLDDHDVGDDAVTTWVPPSTGGRYASWHRSLVLPPDAASEPRPIRGVASGDGTRVRPSLKLIATREADASPAWRGKDHLRVRCRDTGNFGFPRRHG
jgi:hypothetical protein